MADPTLLVAIGGAIASVGTAVYLNRRKIRNLEAWAWGRERDETDAGVAGEHRSLDDKINSIEGKLDTELEERRRDHEDVEREVRVNRRYFSNSIENLATTIDDQLDEADIDVREDVEPDWVSGDRESIRDGDHDDHSYFGRDENPSDD